MVAALRDGVGNRGGEDKMGGSRDGEVGLR